MAWLSQSRQDKTCRLYACLCGPQVPLGHFIPKFFLGGLFMGSGVSFLESSFLSFRSLPPLSVLGYRLPSLQWPGSTEMSRPKEAF